MFKKLKEKITEEVKISPQRFAEFTQSVSDRIQNNTSTDENFFSIAEDDANTSTTINNQGYSSVALVSPSQEDKPRRYSNVSIASDISFLPRYEPSNMYNLQSDLDISASEIEDNVSTTSSQLGHVTKEQIHSAFQKSQMRYHKYRGRFTDLARHYKDLERENAKMKAVLVETQDKAIRRVQELKEQCSLEQKAKAHLESALRDEIDERNYKIKTLETKISLLKTDNHTDQLVNIDGDSGNQVEKNENLMKYLNDARKEIDILNKKLQEMKANAIIFQTKEQEYKMKISNFEKEVAAIAEREKENNLKLAQNKMELHNEILMKDTEMSNLKRENDILKQNLNALDADRKNTENMKLENLQIQNKKLIEKIESLSQRSNNLEKEVLKMETCNIEIENLKTELSDLKTYNTQLVTEKETLINNLNQSEKQYQELTERYQELDKSLMIERTELQEQISNLRDEARKGLLSLEPKIREKLQNQFNQKEVELRREFENKIEELSSNNIGLKEIKLQLLLKDDIIKNMSEELEFLKTEVSKKTDEYTRLETNHLELIDDCNRLRNTISSFEKEKVSLETYEEKIPRLEAHIKTLQDELQESKKTIESFEVQNIGLNAKITELKEKNDELLHRPKEVDTKKLEEISKRYSEECDTLKEKLKLEEENNKQLTERKLHLETELNTLQSDYSLMKQNLQNLEEEYKKMAASYQSDQEMITKKLLTIKRSLCQTDETNETTADLNVMQIITDMQKNCETKQNELITLNQENIKLLQSLNEITEKYHVLEEKLESVQIENTQSKILELKIEKLEEEKNKIGQNFEETRERFNKLMACNKKLEEKEKLYEHNEEKLSKAVEDNLKQADIISSLKNDNLKLQEQKFSLENTLSNLQEKLHILEEKDEAINLDSTECHLLEMKLQKMEEEKRNLLDSFETERIRFNKSYEQLREKEDRINQLTEDNVNLKSLSTKYVEELENFKTILKEKEKLYEETKAFSENKIKEYEERIDKLILSFNKSKSENVSYADKITEISHVNDGLVKQLEEKDIQITKLAENISHLSETIEKQYVDYKNLQEQTDKLMAESQKYQDEVTQLAGEKSRLEVKVEELNREIQLITVEMNPTKEKLIHIENLYKEQLDLNEINKQEIGSLQNQINVWEKKEAEHRNLLENIDKYNNEITKLKSALSNKEHMENNMKQLENDLRDKREEIANTTKENSRLVEEHNKLQQNYTNLEILLCENQTLQEQMSTTKNDLNLKLKQLTTDYQNIIQENESLNNAKEELISAIEEIKNSELSAENEKRAIQEENQELKEKMEEINKQLQHIEQKNLELVAQTKEPNTREVDVTEIQRNFYEIKERFDSLTIENKNLKQEYIKLEDKCNEFGKIKEKMQSQITEAEKQCTEILHEKQLLQDEIQELKILPLNYQNNSSTNLDRLEILKNEQLFSTNDTEKGSYQKEIESLRDKITKYKSLDITNKSSIEFYENELQKLKNQNDKLNRKLDETLVTLNHCAELSSSTEVEYLKNVLYNYMLGKESVVLARVIAAVCKFDPQQTDLILQREQQKQTLLGQLGLI